MFDPKNFKFILDGGCYSMVRGELIINGSSYEEDQTDVDPVYSLARSYAKTKDLIATEQFGRLKALFSDE